MNVTLRTFSKIKDSSRNEGCQKVHQTDSNSRPHDQLSNALTARPTTAAAESTENLWNLCTTLLTLLMYAVASPDPDPNSRGGDQLPYPNECNSTLTSGTWDIYPHRYISMLMSGVTAYVFSTSGGAFSYTAR